MSAAAFVRQAESARENGFAELSTREQATNSEFATSVALAFRPNPGTMDGARELIRAPLS
jgi:hypothetical protein